MVFNNVFQYIHIDLVVIYISCIYFVLLGKKYIYCSICAFGTRLDIYGQITFIFKYTVNIIMEIYIYIYILQSIYNLIYSLKSYMAISSKHTNELPTTKALLRTITAYHFLLAYLNVPAKTKLAFHVHISPIRAMDLTIRLVRSSHTS